MTHPEVSNNQNEVVPKSIVHWEKPSRKSIQREIRKKKSIEKTKRKIKLQKKAERKLVIKAERVKINKRENNKRKLVKKILAREEKGTSKVSDLSRIKPEKKVFVKDNFGFPPKK